MALSINSRRSIWSSAMRPVRRASGVTLFGQVPIPTPAEMPEEAVEQTPLAAEKALEELEERYNSLLESVDVEKFKPEYLSRYITNAEKRRGAPFTEAEKAKFKIMANSKDPESLKLLALELRIGISKKVERYALAAMGNLMLYRDQEDALKRFMAKPKKDPNLKAYVRTILMMNRVERWVGRYESLKHKLTHLLPEQKANG